MNAAKNVERAQSYLPAIRTIELPVFLRPVKQFAILA